MSLDPQGSPAPVAPESLNAKDIVNQIAETEPPKAEEPAKVEEKKEDPLSPRFAALAKRQKQIDAEKSAIKLEREKFLAERAEYDEWKKKQGEPKKKLSPLEALQAEGYTYQEATEFILNNEQPTADHKLKEIESKFERLEREQKEREAKLLTDAKAKEEQLQQETIERFKKSIDSHLTTNSEKYELVALYGANSTVFETIEEYFETHKKVLSIDEAAQMVESYLEGELERASKTKKFSSKYKAADAPKVDEKTADKVSTSQTTLSNIATASSTPVKAPAKTDAERMRRAMEILDRASQ